MSVVPKLNFNKHPKDCDNLSLVDARNIKISHDESCITNENSIITNALIQTAIHNIYRNNFLIRGIIPINTFSGITTSDPSDNPMTVLKENTLWYKAAHN